MKKNAIPPKGTHTFKSNEAPPDMVPVECVVCGVLVRWFFVRGVMKTEYRKPGRSWQPERIACHVQTDLFGAR